MMSIRTKKQMCRFIGVALCVGAGLAATVGTGTTSMAAEPRTASAKARSDRSFRGGSFGELRKLPPIPGRVIVCMPALSVFLSFQEKRLGRGLTASEFKSFRDMAPAIEMDRADAEALKQGEPLPVDMTFATWQAMRGK